LGRRQQTSQSRPHSFSYCLEPGHGNKHPVSSLEASWSYEPEGYIYHQTLLHVLTPIHQLIYITKNNVPQDCVLWLLPPRRRRLQPGGQHCAVAAAAPGPGLRLGAATRDGYGSTAGGVRLHRRRRRTPRNTRRTRIRYPTGHLKRPEGRAQHATMSRPEGIRTLIRRSNEHA
jgi:hypothetical protein